MLSCCIIVSALYTPYVYIPAKSESLGVTKHKTSLILSVLGATNTAFRVLAGFLADLPAVDSVHVHNVSVIVAGILTCLVCVFNTWEQLIMFTGLFGAFLGKDTFSSYALLGLISSTCLCLSSVSDPSEL